MAVTGAQDAEAEVHKCQTSAIFGSPAAPRRRRSCCTAPICTRFSGGALPSRRSKPWRAWRCTTRRATSPSAKPEIEKAGSRPPFRYHRAALAPLFLARVVAALFAVLACRLVRTVEAGLLVAFRARTARRCGARVLRLTLGRARAARGRRTRGARGPLHARGAAAARWAGAVHRAGAAGSRATARG